MHKMKLGDFFKTWHFLISECNLAGFLMLKTLTEKLSGLFGLLFFFGFLCCTNHRDDLFLGVLTFCTFDILVVKVCETRFKHLPTS